jgi:CDP-diacylglycerol--glycerol-3-phosphate 3-phosphatidyltransferase/cardiolipin synthase
MGDFALRDLVTIPGLLSLARIPLAALFPFAAANPPLAIGVLALAAATDVADGWYARRFGQETPTGRVLDPITDKTFVAAVVITLIATDVLSMTEALLLGSREICELALLLQWVIAFRDRPRPTRGANRLGKLATTMQFVTVAAILLGTPSRRAWVLVTAACGVLSGFAYALREWRDVR